MNKEAQEQIELAKSLLKREGFTISIHGCGCCESPVVRIAYKGEDIVFEEEQHPDGWDDSRIVPRENVNFDMFE